MNLQAFSFPALSGSPMERIEAVYQRMQKASKRIRRAVNQNEYREFITQASADNDATLDIGDIDGPALWANYDFLVCRLSNVRPALDGDYLFMRYGGAGSWWTAANYNYATSTTSGTGQTQVQLFADIAAMRQGNLVNEDFIAELMFELATGDAAQGGRACMGEMTWADVNTSPVRSNLVVRYPTTAHLSAFRFWYNGGNIYGTAQLWGLPRK